MGFSPTEYGQLSRNMQCPIKEYEERIVNDVTLRLHKSCKVRSIRCNRMLKYNITDGSVFAPQIELAVGTIWFHKFSI
jgi:hypothetical protein